MDSITDALSAALDPSQRASNTSQTDSTSASSSVLAEDEFLQIMIAELTNQDPLEPLDNQQFLNQLVQTQTLQATTRLADGIESLLLGQQIASAGSLVGQEVAAVDANGEEVRGTVERVLVEDGEVRLGLNGRVVALDQVREIAGENSLTEAPTPSSE